MKIKITLRSFVFLMAMIMVIPAMAQSKKKPFKKAKITFDITYDNADELEPALLSQLPKEFFTYFMGDYTKEELNIGPTSIYSIKNHTTNTAIQLVDNMGQKKYHQMTEEELKHEDGPYSNIQTSFPDETKEIAGYVCKKAIITYEHEDLEEEQTATVFFSEELGSEHTNFAGSLYKQVPGRLMQYSIHLMELKLNLLARSVEKAKLKETSFMIPEDYEEFKKEDQTNQ